MKSLGLTAEETNMIRAVVVIVSSISPLVIGLIGDRFGNYKVVFNFLFQFPFIIEVKLVFDS